MAKAKVGRASSRTRTAPKAGAKGLESHRRRLEQQRQEIFSLYERDLQVGQEAGDTAGEDIVDRANNSYNRELMFSLSDAERQMLIHIEDAYQRLEEGSYGLCLHCTEPIGLPRLKALPWARYCIGCQELEEMGLLDA